MNEGTMATLLKRLRRAARTGERLHLDSDHARALMDSRVYRVLCEIEAEELRAEWQDNDEPDLPKVPPPPLTRDDSSLAPSGFGIAAIGMTGTSAGSTVASLGAHRRVLAVTKQIRRKTQK